MAQDNFEESGPSSLNLNGGVGESYAIPGWTPGQQGQNENWFDRFMGYAIPIIVAAGFAYGGTSILGSALGLGEAGLASAGTGAAGADLTAAGLGSLPIDVAALTDMGWASGLGGVAEAGLGAGGLGGLAATTGGAGLAAGSELGGLAAGAGGAEALAGGIPQVIINGSTAGAGLSGGAGLAGLGALGGLGAMGAFSPEAGVAGVENVPTVTVTGDPALGELAEAGTGAGIPLMGAGLGTAGALLTAEELGAAPVSDLSGSMIDPAIAGAPGLLGTLGSLLGPGGALGGLLGGLGDLIGGNVDRIHNQQDQEYYDNLMNKMMGMYQPGTPEATLMQHQMEAKDAAAGRNSQYGTRATNLAAQLAQQRAGIMTSPTFGKMADASRGHYDNSLNSLFAAFGSGGGGAGGSGGSGIGSTLGNISNIVKGLGSLFGSGGGSSVTTATTPPVR